MKTRVTPVRALFLAVVCCAAFQGCEFVLVIEPGGTRDLDGQAEIPGNADVRAFRCSSKDVEVIVLNDTPCGAIVKGGAGKATTFCMDVPDDRLNVDEPSGITCGDCLKDEDGDAIRIAACGTGGCDLVDPKNGESKSLSLPGGVTAFAWIDPRRLIIGKDGILDCDASGLTCTETQPPAGARTVRWMAVEPFAGAYRYYLYDDGALYGETDGAPLEKFNLPGGARVNDFTLVNGDLYLATTDGLAIVPRGSGSIFKVDIGVDEPYTLETISGRGEDFIVSGTTRSGDSFIRIHDENGWRLGGTLAWTITSLGYGPIVVSRRPRPLAAGGPTVYAGTNAGVFRSPDGGVSWVPVEGIRTATVTRVLATPEHVFAGTFRNANAVYRSTDSGATWTQGDAPLVNQIARAIAAVGNSVVASGETGIFRSTDGGATWVKGVTGLPAGTTFFCMTTVGGTMLGGSSYLNATSPGGIYKSTDGGATWTSSGQGLPVNVNVGTVAASGSLVVATVTTSLSRSVYRSSDGGATWTPGFVFAQGSPVALEFSGPILYAGLTGTATDHLFKSTDGGLTFTPSGTGLANRRVLALASSGGTLFAGTFAGLFWSTDGGASWSEFTSRLRGIEVFSLAATSGRIYAGTVGASLWTFRIPPRVQRLVPIVLDVDTGSAHFSSELALTNASAAGLDLTLLYTPSIGSGSGSVPDHLSAGEQRLIPDVIAYLRGKGVAIPSTGSQGGTLLVTFEGPVDPRLVSVTARTGAATTAPQPVGKAGLAYVGKHPGDGFRESVIVYGLRESQKDRSNFAVYNTTGVPVTLRVTAFSGTGDGKSAVVAAADTLPPWGWKQYNRILDGVSTNGYVRVERLSADGAFGCYGVINDNGTNDGSFLEPTAGFVVPYLNVPVLVETPAFLSELVLANSGAVEARLTLTYSESLSASGGGGTFQMSLPAGSQMIIASSLDFLRGHRVAIGPRGTSSYAGGLHIAVEGASISDVWAGARTASQSQAAGQFGLFTPGVFAGGEELTAASLYGLLSNADNRSNVAVINTAVNASSSITLSIQGYDGAAGGAARGTPDIVTLEPGQWKQIGNFLATKGVANGWVKITRTTGSAPWIAYGVINDGGSPGQRTGDGAYVPMSR